MFNDFLSQFSPSCPRGSTLVQSSRNSTRVEPSHLDPPSHGLVYGAGGPPFCGWLGTGLGLHPMVVLAWKGIQWPTAILFVSISCSLIYYCGPKLKERRRWQWFTPGSAFGGLVWLAASFGFRIYLHFFDNYSTSYGSLGAVMILLVWLYVSGLACLIGAEINAEIECAGSRGRDACERDIE